MPLVICRACKSYAGKAINYITDRKKAERVMVHGLDETRSLAQQFIDTAALHGKGDEYGERKYYHIKISFEPKDRIENGGELNAELAEKIADEYFRKQYGKHEYILATHMDKEHIHCHAIINAVSYENGKKIQHSNKDLADMKDSVNDVAERHGVSRFDWRQSVKDKRQKAKEERASAPKELTQAEKYIRERHGEEWATSSWKETLRIKITEAKEQSTSREEFEKYLLGNYGVEMPRNTSKTVSFKHPAVGETVRGVKLGAEYTAESIDQAIKENKERSVNHAKLRHTEERAAAHQRTGGNARAVIGDNENNIEPKDKRSGNSVDEGGKRAIETSISELYGKLQEIRELDNEFNPRKHEQTDEAVERNRNQAGTEAERAENEQRGSKQKHRRRGEEH